VSSTSAFGKNIAPAAADAVSKRLVANGTNVDLQWSEGSYRGFFTLELTTERATATYYAMRNVSYPNLDGFVSAVFEVEAGTCWEASVA
jgi:alkaline phosphatase D